MRASRYASALVAVAMLSLVWSRASDAQGSGGEDQMERPEVRSLDLRGVASVDRDEVLQSISTSESSCKSLLLFAFCRLSHSDRFWDKAYLDRTELRRDVLRIRVFYWLRGFREAQVDTVVDRRSRDAVNVTFRIGEGRPTLLRNVQVESEDSVLTDDEITSLLEVERGKPFNLVALDSTLVRIRGVLQDRGYPNARTDTTTATDTVTRLADVRITVRPGPLTHVGEIRVTGESKVSERTIRNSLSFKTGDLFVRRELSESQRRLYESALFQRASISAARFGDSATIARLARARDSLREFGTQAQLDSLREVFFARLGDSAVRHIDVEVVEAPLRLARVGGGFNTFDFIQVDGRYTQNNFFGGARRLDISGTVGNLFANQLNGSNIGGVIGFQDITEDIVGEADDFLKPTYQASVDFMQPWLFSPRNSAGVGVFAYRRQAPAVFVERGEGANISFTREVAERVPVSLAYRFELTGIQAGDVYFCVNYGVCDPQTIGALRTRQRLSPLQLTGFVNRRNDPLMPTRGYTAEARLEHASAFTGSGFRYNRVYIEGAAYRPVGSRAVLAGHARVGFVRALASTRVATRAGDDLSGDILHPRTRLYAGGARSVRGVGENQLGPRVLTVPPSKLAVICPDLTGAAIAECDLSRTDTAGSALADRDFTPRPLGGRALLEGSVEFRFPVWRNIYGAGFVDGALLGQGSLESAAKGAGAVTPGIGIRYLSAVGPIRVDIGLNPSLPEELPVITQVEGTDGLRIIQLRDTWRYHPTGGASGITGILRRLTLHLSIGEAY